MRDADRVQEQILKIINDDPTIEGAGHIIVSVEKKGVWPRVKEVVVLKGNVRSDSDRVKAEKVAALHSAATGGRQRHQRAHVGRRSVRRRAAKVGWACAGRL